MLFKCIKCGTKKERNRENFHRLKINGKETFHTKCKDCRKEEKLELNWKDNKLLCKICGEYLEIENFGITKKSGSEYRNNRDGRCRTCRTKQSSDARNTKTGDLKIARVIKERFLGARLRANRKNLAFNITEDYLLELLIKQQGKCAISKTLLTFELGSGRINTNISIDRIDPKLGYIEGNIQLVCMAINQMKNDLTQDELYFWCNKVLENHGGKK